MVGYFNYDFFERNLADYVLVVVGIDLMQMYLQNGSFLIWLYLSSISRLTLSTKLIFWMELLLAIFLGTCLKVATALSQA